MGILLLRGRGQRFGAFHGIIGRSQSHISDTRVSSSHGHHAGFAPVASGNFHLNRTELTRVNLAAITA